DNLTAAVDNLTAALREPPRFATVTPEPPTPDPVRFITTHPAHETAQATPVSNANPTPSPPSEGVRFWTP
ncbi:MAG: hypothetical protein AAFX76_13010, partial [Planctomycetota bacterium]